MRSIKNRGTLRRRHLLPALAGMTCALAIFAWLSASAVAGPACSDDFTGASDGAWSLAGNWTSATDSSEHAVPGTLDVVCLGGTTVSIASGSAHADSVQGQGGGILIDGGQLTLNSTTDSSTVASLTLDDAGELSAPASQTVTVTGDIEWGQCTSCGDAMMIDATIVQTAGSAGSLDIDGPGTGVSGPFLEGGSITTNSPVSITNPVFYINGAFSLSTTSTLTLGTGVQLDGDDPGAAFTATGLNTPAGTEGLGPASLNLDGSATTTIGRNTTLQTGAITLTSGTLQDDGGIQAAPGRSESLTINGGTLAGEGNLGGPVTNVSGTVAPGDGDATPGTLTFSNSYTQDAGGTLDIGLGPTSTFGQLQVDGAVQAGGDLVPELGSYTPAPGQSWIVVYSVTSVLSGQFTLSGADASAVAATYLPSSLKLAGPTGGTTTGTTTTTTPAGSTTTGTGTTATGTGTTATGTGTTATGTGSTTTTGGSGSSVGVNGAPGGSDTHAPSCTSPSGRITARAVGPLALGALRTQTHQTLGRFTARGASVDYYCLSDGSGLFAGYPSATLLRALPRSVRAQLSGRSVLALSSSRGYLIGRVTPGTKLAAAIRSLRLKLSFKASGSSWFVAGSGESSRYVVVARGKVVTQIGVANAKLVSSGHKLLRSFAGA